jgi:hypothetical protein
MEELNSDEAYCVHLLLHSMNEAITVLVDVQEILNKINGSLERIADALERIYVKESV